MQRHIDRARALVEAMPRIARFRGRRVVVKIGGAALEDLSLRERFAEDVTLLHLVGVKVVVVHGGGKQVSHMLGRLGLTPAFVRGQRVTDADTLEVVEMVLGGALNQEIVRLIHRRGGQAVGLTGKDGAMAGAHRQPGLGLVGQVVRFDPAVIERLEPGFIPVIAPLALDETPAASPRPDRGPDSDSGPDRGPDIGPGALNVNADAFASRAAVALGADRLIFVSDVPGVRGPTPDGADPQEGGDVLPTLTCARARQLIDAGVISGGMIPKIEHALAALAAGVGAVHIIDGRREHGLVIDLFTGGGAGTEVIDESRGTS